MTSHYFAAPIIDASKYRKWKPFRYGFYYLLLFMTVLIINPRTIYRRYPSLLERLNLNLEVYAIVLFVIVVVTLSIYFYSRNHSVLGELNIFNDHLLIIIDGQELRYEYSAIEQFTINRGSTFQYTHRKRNYLLKTNNWITFKLEGKQLIYEFEIESPEKNEAFENMIQALYKHRINFSYLSV